jgi:TATA-binding protein-associated factor
MQTFVNDARVPQSSVPQIGGHMDPTGADPNAFTLDTARAWATTIYDALIKEVPKSRKKDMTALSERRLKIAASIERYVATKSEYDTRVSAAYSAAFIALRSTPDKVSPIVKGIMNGVKVEFYVFLMFVFFFFFFFFFFFRS